MLEGGTGDDRIEGGEGDDTLSGGEGRDTYVLSGLFGSDRIEDFVSGEDKIEFSGFSSDDVTMTPVDGGSGTRISVDVGGIHYGDALIDGYRVASRPRVPGDRLRRIPRESNHRFQGCWPWLMPTVVLRWPCHSRRSLRTLGCVHGPRRTNGPGHRPSRLASLAPQDDGQSQ